MFKLSQIIFILLAIIPQAHAQDFGSLFAGRSPFFSAKADYFSASQQEEFGLALGQTLYRSSQRQIGANFRNDKLRLGQSRGLPKSYQRQEGGLSYTHQLDGPRFWSVSASYGSASDEPFEDSSVSTLSANFLYRTSGRWFFLANYSNNRSFLNNIPIPSIVYAHTMEREKTILIGVPFLLIRTPLSQSLSLQYTGLFPYMHRLALSFQHNRFIRSYFGVNQSVSTYLRFDRERDKDRVYLARRKAYLGLQASLARQLQLDLQGGHAFGQRLFESDGFTGDRYGTLKLDDGTYLKVSLNISVF